MKKALLATLIASATLTTSVSYADDASINSDNAPSYASEVKFASFNVSFAHDNNFTAEFDENYEMWVAFMTTPVTEQNRLIEKWKSGDVSAEEDKLAERYIQIRNIAAIIQKNRPDVLLLTEFNNDGEGKDMEALAGFQTNYLSVPQSMNSVDGGSLLEPISYPFVENYATNTGLHSGHDLSNNGNFEPSDTANKHDYADDAHGYGFYHGQYAFALMSKYEIDTDNTRTFQTFLRKDLAGTKNPVVEQISDKNDCAALEARYGVACGETWFTAEEWNVSRLSSKNHVDAPIIIPTKDGDKVVHALLSHPTPAAFDKASHNNKLRNSQEIEFWKSYIHQEATLYDDQGTKGGFSGEHFVLMGDLNADAQHGTGSTVGWDGIRQLMNDELVHQDVSKLGGKHTPVSQGALKAKNPATSWSGVHSNPETRTSTFGSRVDYAVPSASLQVTGAGVYWQPEGAEGRLLFNDERLGSKGTDKQVSSDHRFVWTTVKVK